MTALSASLLVVALVGIGLYGTAWTVTLWWTRRAARLTPPADQTGVTILKPLCGLDEELEANLLSFFAVAHEPVQLVFGAAAHDDPALAVVRNVARRHPYRDVAIVIGGDSDAASPKVGLLEALLPHARHDVILLSDSNVRIGSDEIGRVLPCFADPRVGMAYQPVVGVGERSLPALIENLHYTELAGLLSIGAAIVAGQHAVNAKGQWVRRRALDDIGGFSAVRDHGADDFVLSRLVAGAGWRLALAPVPVRIVHRDWSWRGLVQRHLRHSGLRRRICPWAYPLELVVNPVSWVVALTVTGHAVWVLPVVVLKIALEVSAARLLRCVPLAPRHIAAILVKDGLYCIGWFASFAIRTVAWRGRTYAIGPGGRLDPVESLPEPAFAARPAA